MAETTQTRFLGDSAALALALVHPDTGVTFPPAGNTLLFTVKAFLTDADTAALVQKVSTVGGIIIGGQIGSDFCTTQAIMFQREGQWANPAGIPPTSSRNRRRKVPGAAPGISDA